MNELQIFNYESKEIRTIMIDNEPWWVAKDVCEVLGHTNTTMALERLDVDEVTKFNLGGLAGETNVVNEPGLYSLILGSRKPEAKSFKRWLTHEVIPSIRKTGQYALKSNTDLSKLPADLQILHQMTSVLTQQALQIQKVETSIESIKETIIYEPHNWREEINRMLNKVAVKIGQDQFRTVRTESYKLLDSRAKTNLDRRLENHKKRLLEQGSSKSKIEAANKMDIIEADPKLREIYSQIIKEYTIKYCC